MRKLLWVAFVSVVLIAAACNLEAELPTSVSGPVEFVDDGTAAGGRFARLNVDGSGNGTATYDFFVNSDYDEYPQIIWVRTRCATPGRHVTVTVNDTAPVDWMIQCPAQNPDAWFWSKVTPSGSSEPATWDLSEGGTHSLTLTAGDGAVEVDKIWVGPISSGSPNGVGARAFNVKTVTVQAEAASQNGSKWSKVNDYASSTNKAMKSIGVASNPGSFEDGTLTFTFDAPVEGAYRMWTRSVAPDTASDGFNVQVNDISKGELRATPSADWVWSRLNYGYFGHLIVDLKAGENTVQIEAIETGLVLDKVLFTNGVHDLPSLGEIVDPLDDAWPAGGDFDLLTEGDHQYVTYYNKDRRITVAHRRLSQPGIWQKKVLTGTGSFFAYLDGFDTHNYLTSAVDANGDFHVSGNMHVEPMSYWRTSTPHDISTLEPRPMPEAEPGNTTYPEFYNGSGSDLFFTYRGGTSGNGEVYVNSYNTSTKTWGGVGPSGVVPGAPAEYLVGGCGAVTDPAAIGASNIANCDAGEYGREYAYNRMVFDGSKFHLAWNWRTVDYSGHTNVIASHDISYVWSPNMVDWYLAGQQAGVDPPLAWPLEYDGAADPKIIEHLPPGTADPNDPLPTRLGGGLHNSWWNLSFDASGEPVVSYSKYVYPGGNQVDSIVARARFNGSAWDIVNQPPADGSCEQAAEGGPTGRSVPQALVVERDGTLSQTIKDCDAFFSSNQRINSSDLSATPRSYAQADIVPPQIRELEGTFTNRDFCGDYTGIAAGQQLADINAELDTTTAVRTIRGRGDAADGRKFFIRWHRVPNESFDRPEWCSGDPLNPTAVRLYEAKP